MRMEKGQAQPLRAFIRLFIRAGMLSDPPFGGHLQYLGTPALASTCDWSWCVCLLPPRSVSTGLDLLPVGKCECEHATRGK